MRRLNTVRGTPAPRRTLRFKSLPTRGSARRRAEASAQRQRQVRRANGDGGRGFNLRSTLASWSLLPARRNRRSRFDESGGGGADSGTKHGGLRMHRGGGQSTATTRPFRPFETVDDVLLQELAAAAPQQRNWRGILIAFFMIFMISVLIVAAVLVFTPLDANKIETKKPLSLKDATGPVLNSHIEAMEWLDGQKLVVRVNEVIEVIDFGQQPWQNTTLLDSEALPRERRDLSISVGKNSPLNLSELDPQLLQFAPLPNAWLGRAWLRFLLRQAYRHGKVKSTNIVPGTPYVEITYFAEKKNHAYDTTTNKRIYNTKTGNFESIGPEKSGSESVDALKFNPVGPGYVFAHKWNLYFRPLIGSRELVRITTNGHTDLRHGITSWAYQEELYGPDAFWWSPDGEEVAFMTTNLQSIEAYNITWYGGHQYPEQQNLRYAKTGVEGRALEQVEFSVWNKRTKSLVKMAVDLPDDRKVYAMHADFVRLHGANVLVVVFANRFQDEVTYTMCTSGSGKCVPAFFQSYEIGEFHQSANTESVRIAAYTNDSIFTILPHRRPNGDVYNQIARLTIPQRNTMHAHCVSCGISPNCTFHETTMADASSSFFMNCKGPGPTTVFVARAHPNDTTEVLAEFGQNSERELEIASKRFPRVVFENVTLSSGHVAFTRLFLPHGLVEDGHKKYPVLVYVYGGPFTRSVHEEWVPEMPTDIYFSSTLDYIIVSIDGRGSTGEGWKRRQPMYGHLGTVEVEDQLEALKGLLQRFKFMDKKRAIARDDEHLIKCAAMVGPVTNFRMYDAIYTERYMGNASAHAYELTNVARNVTNFHGRRTLLIHGLADDNVHFQNAAELITALVRENVGFDLMVYPDELHSLKGVRPHMFDKLIHHFKSCFDELAAHE
ncbi:hypothetical protein M3Y99_01010300 [Aphelenchoides fujianensis]|nr:hypothetical protein M3Y99_01010300 [Aphelenchoides fujianensis]